MADFCKDCSIRVHGIDSRDLSGFTKIEHTEQKIFATVLCEGCGLIKVDHEGKCVEVLLSTVDKIK